MADQPDQPTPSGSRWEPDPNEPTNEATAYASYGVPAIEPEVEQDADTPAEQRRAQLRRRGGLAGAAAALVLGAGLTGFVIGHATAGEDGNGFTPANFSGQVPGQLGEGQQGPPGFGDRDGDHGGDHGRDHGWDQNGGGFGQQAPGTGGSSATSPANPT